MGWLLSRMRKEPSPVGEMNSPAGFESRFPGATIIRAVCDPRLACYDESEA